MKNYLGILSEPKFVRVFLRVLHQGWNNILAEMTMMSHKESQSGSVEFG